MILVTALLIGLLVFIGFDYGRLIMKDWRNTKEEEYVPVRNIFIAAPGEESRVLGLDALSLSAHQEVGVKVRDLKETEHMKRVFFENGDESLLVKYNKDAPIDALTKQEIEEYVNSIYFDYELPEGAERAVIEQLGLIGYAVKIGICSDEKGDR